MHKMFLSCLLTAVLTAAAVAAAFVVGTGYFVGNYAVHFGLERGTVENPQEPPRAFALLMPRKHGIMINRILQMKSGR